MATDPFGVSGWAMLPLLAKGETDVPVQAAEARAALKEALAGRRDPIYRTLRQQNLDQVELWRRQIGEVDKALAAARQAHTATLLRWSKMPGVDLASAQELWAEIGPGALAFATAEQFACWVGVLSGQPRVGGRLFQPPAGEGEPLSEAAMVADCWGGHSHQRDNLRGSVRQATRNGDPLPGTHAHSPANSRS